MGDLVHRLTLKLKHSITVSKSLPVGPGMLGALSRIFRAKPDDLILHYPAYVPVKDVRGLSRVLLIGDSISIGYTLAVRRALKGKANVQRPADNCGSTDRGVERLEKWLGDGRWDMILFNFGLHDMVRIEEGAVVPLDRYAANLRSIVRRLESTRAHLLWANTTPVPRLAPVPHEDMRYMEPDGEILLGYFEEDVAEYNRVASEVMSEFGIGTIDLYSYVLPVQGALQVEKDIHFTKAGYAALGAEVGREIGKKLLVRPGVRG